MKYGLDSKLHFGKYKGRELWWVIENDLDYMNWLMEDRVIRVNNEAFEVYLEAKQRKRSG